MTISFELNGKPVSLEADADMPLLWAVREKTGLTGTKYGCGIAQCGACTVHINGAPARSCSTPVAAVAGGKVTTIEGLDGKVADAVRTSWQQLNVVQCGYCQSGQIMSAVALLTQAPKPSDADIDNAMRGNICRCATYHRIRAAIHAASTAMEA